MDLPQIFLDEMKEIVPDFDGFIRSFSLPPEKAFRVNDVKISDEKLLSSLGVKEKVKFADHCYYLGDEKLGKTALHHAGLLYIQEPSAMLPVSAYDIHANLALDLCAAPGGKTIHLASKVERLVSNEIIPSRAAVLKSNVERLGLRNVAVTNNSPSELEKLGEIFDLMLVDAPCSGEGMFRKDETAIREWSLEHSISCAARQKAILNSADKLLKRGGTLIYSTCTFSKRENEDVVFDFLHSHDGYSLIMPSEAAKNCTVSLSDEYMRRFYPHIGRGEGQFFVALKKQSGGEGKLPRSMKFSENKEVIRFLNQTIGHAPRFVEHGGSFFFPALSFELPVRTVSGGVKIGKTEKTFKPDHYFFSAYGSEMFSFEPSAEELVAYLHGEELAGDHIGYGAVSVLGAPLGGFKGVDGRYKNLYPKGLRN